MGRTSLDAFAIFGAIVMFSLAFVQPVTAKESGQVDILKKYDHYITTAEKLIKEISSDDSIKSILDERNDILVKVDEFNKKISSDSEIKIFSQKLFENEKLKSILNRVKNAKSYEEIKALSENFEKTLKSTEEYKQIEKLVKERYSDDISSIEKSVGNYVDRIDSIINSKYGKEIKVLEDFAKKLQNRPDDTEKLVNALLQKSGINGKVGMGGDLYAIKAEPYGNSHSTKSAYRAQAKSSSVSVGYFSGNPHEKMGASGSVKFGNHHGGPDHETVSMNATAKFDMNGNVYYWVPGYGWINLGNIDPTLLGDGILGFLLLLLSIPFWVIGVTDGVIGYVLAFIGTFIMYGVAPSIEFPLIALVVFIIGAAIAGAGFISLTKATIFLLIAAALDVIGIFLILPP